MPASPRMIGLIPAAGHGTRFGSQQPKQYMALGGLSLLAHSAKALLADHRVSRVFVAVAPGDVAAAPALAGIDGVELIHTGGQERVNTVLNSINHLLENGRVGELDWLLVHDAARPGLDAESLGRLIDQASEHVAGGLLALPVADTLKRAHPMEGGVHSAAQTVPRDDLWAAQTPQMFRAQALQMALSESLFKGLKVTDEASAIEMLGISPLLVQGRLSNMKVTFPEDLPVVARLMGVEHD